MNYEYLFETIKTSIHSPMIIGNSLIKITDILSKDTLQMKLCLLKFLTIN